MSHNIVCKQCRLPMVVEGSTGILTKTVDLRCVWCNRGFAYSEWTGLVGDLAWPLAVLGPGMYFLLPNGLNVWEMLALGLVFPLAVALALPPLREMTRRLRRDIER